MILVFGLTFRHQSMYKNFQLDFFGSKNILTLNLTSKSTGLFNNNKQYRFIRHLKNDYAYLPS